MVSKHWNSVDCFFYCSKSKLLNINIKIDDEPLPFQVWGISWIRKWIDVWIRNIHVPNWCRRMEIQWSGWVKCYDGLYYIANFLGIENGELSVVHGRISNCLQNNPNKFNLSFLFDLGSNKIYRLQWL